MRKRIAMIGLDAAELELVRAHRRQLPTLARALETGVLTRLRSPAGLLAGSVWPTFFTGTHPGEHGIYHHLQWDAGRMRLRRVAEDWLPCEPFWYELERRGLDVVAVDVPMTSPSRLTRGVEVTTWGSHDQLTPFAARPAALAAEIRRRFGHHPMGDEIPVEKTPRERERIRARLVEGARRKGELSAWLLESRPWDFFITVFGECHRGGHLLWPEGEGEPPTALLDVYRAVDASVGRLLEILAREQATVILFALHGMGPNTSQEHLVPRVMDRVNGRPAGAAASAGHAPAARRGFVRMLRETLPAPLQNAVARAVPVWVRDRVVDRAVTGGHDWRATPGLAVLADLNGYLRLNLRGRERDGILDPGSEAYRRYLGRVHAAFAGLRAAPSGAPLVDAVRCARDDFPGARSHHLPDLVVTWTGGPPAAAATLDDGATLSAALATGRTGNHRPDGFAVVMEPGARAGAEAAPGHVADLAGTVTRMLLGEAAR
ncbi:MAG: alkaline phosphatase family protein [Longimicrobiaceae bacterium]